MSTMNTHFAPTARSSPEEIAHSHRTLADDGVLTQTLDAFPELVLVLNQNREVVLANEVACRALGRTVPEMLGKRPGELVECEQVRKAPCGCGTSEACRTCGAVFAILESQQGRPSIRECRVSRRTAKGFESLDLRVACRALTAQAESFTVFVATDISAEKRRDVLERIFFHDILNLAGVVQGFVSLLVDNLLTIEEVRTIFTRRLRPWCARSTASKPCWRQRKACWSLKCAGLTPTTSSGISGRPTPATPPPPTGT